MRVERGAVMETKENPVQARMNCQKEKRGKILWSFRNGGWSKNEGRRERPNFV